MVRDLLEKKDELGNQAHVIESFDLSNVQDRQIEDLSGGELQRFACAMVCIQKGDIFMFDEPSSYLDVKQRLKAALAIRDIVRENRLVKFYFIEMYRKINKLLTILKIFMYLKANILLFNCTT